MAVAPPGTGKTSGLIVPNLLKVPNSSFVLDIKPELEEPTSTCRRELLGNEVLIFNPFAINIKGEYVIDENGDEKENRHIDYKEHSMFFNPFAREQIQHLSNVF